LDIVPGTTARKPGANSQIRNSFPGAPPASHFSRLPDFAAVVCGFPLSFGFGFPEKSGILRGPLPFLPLDGLT
jgi:hypothetical protein